MTLYPPPGRITIRDVPDELAERLALHQHRRDCSAHDGRNEIRPPPFKGRHRDTDMHRAKMALCDVTNALGIPLEDLDRELP